jgi:hypothetical protein
MDIVKNPVIIGLLAGTITYAYLTWSLTEKNKKRQKKGQKKEEVNLIIPLVVTIIGWFIAYAYFEHAPEKQPHPSSLNFLEKTHNVRMPMPLPIAPQPGYKFVGDVVSESSDPKSFSLLAGGGISIPTKLPDVLLELK